jgi:ubiquinone/menaquinone biosynthesis C-methylase UbiE
MSVPWWRHHFDDDYFALHDPLFTEKRSRREVAGMRELLALPHGATVLDAPCGWGRHTALLAEAGLHVTGADLSPALLAHAPRRSEAETPPAYVAADIRALPFANATFDAVINVYTSLGLFLNADEDVAALREARRVLRSGGALLLESMHRDDVIAHYAERDAWKLPDGTRIRVRRRFDPITGISREKMAWRRGEETGRKQHALRLRTATEIAALLRAAGFTFVKYFGDWQGTPFRYSADSLIAVARS